MGACYSSKSLSKQKAFIDTTLSTRQMQPPTTQRSIKNICENELNPPEDNISIQSDNDLLATDELPNQLDQSAIDKEHINQIAREVNCQQHQPKIQKRFLFVYDKVYKQQRRVPILNSLKDSTLIKRRQLIICQ